MRTAVRCAIIGLAVLSALPSQAQQAAPFAPVADRELWEAMTRAFADVPMSLGAHQQVQQIMANVQREAAMRAARAKTEKSKPAIEKPKSD